MKKTILAAVLAVFLAPLSVNAEGGMHRGDWQEKRLEHLTKKLDLTPEQQASFKAALEEKQAKMEAAQTEFKAKIDSILTPEQKKKHDEMKDDMKDKMKERREDRREKRDQKDK